MVKLTEKCSNCANACMVHAVYAPTENIRFCSKFIEIIPSNHSCVDFVEIGKVNYVWLQDFKTKKINKHQYPLQNEIK